jgi:ATP-dependent Clp protease adaptor protein ClpS
MTTALDTDTVVRLKTPKLHNVIFLNDDYTPMEFVLQILIELFNKSTEEAYEIAMAVHKNGRGVAGTYTREIAEQKVADVLTISSANKQVLKAITEIA